MLSQITLVPHHHHKEFLPCSIDARPPLLDESSSGQHPRGGSSTFLKLTQGGQPPLAQPTPYRALRQSLAEVTPSRLATRLTQQGSPRPLLSLPRTRCFALPPPIPVLMGARLAPNTGTRHVASVARAGGGSCGLRISRRLHSLCALPSIPLSFSLATILPPEPIDFDFS